MKAILLAILGIVLGFLAGAFYSVGFDISQWSDDCRFATLLCMFFAGAFGTWIGAELK